MPKKQLVVFDLNAFIHSIPAFFINLLLFIIKFTYTVGYTVRTDLSLLFYTIYRALFLRIRVSRLGDFLRKLIRHTPGDRTFFQSLRIFGNEILIELLHIFTGFPKRNISLPIPAAFRRKYLRAFVRRTILYGAPLAATIVLTVLIFSAKNYALGVNVLINGESVGVIANQNDFSVIKHRADSYVSSITGQSFDSASHTSVSFDVILANKEQFQNTQPIEDALIASVGDIIVKSYGISVEGNLIGGYNSKKDLDNLLAEILQKYKPADDPNARVEFVQDVRVIQSYMPQEKLMTLDEIKNALTKQTVRAKTYKVAKNDVFVSIAKSFNMSTDQLSQLNPGINPDKLQIGMQLVVERPSSILPVKVIKKERTTESLPFTKTVVNTNTLYTGQTRISTKGKNGTVESVFEIFNVDNVEIARNELSRTITKNPVKQVELHGTKKLPPTVSTGIFIWPVRGPISSEFGRRHGKMHTGIDIAPHRGTPIVAADGGTVIFAGWSGSYGKLVKIDHGGGKQTWYAHCNSILVKKGQKVAKGQTIATVGSTGNSTGPHLHFEVRINGQYKNPRSYVK